MRSECPFPDGLCICVGGVESHRHPEDRERIAAELGRERLRIADLEAELAEAREAEKAMRERMEWTVTDNAKQRMAVDDLRAENTRLRAVVESAMDETARLRDIERIHHAGLVGIHCPTCNHAIERFKTKKASDEW